MGRARVMEDRQHREPFRNNLTEYALYARGGLRPGVTLAEDSGSEEIEIEIEIETEIETEIGVDDNHDSVWVFQGQNVHKPRSRANTPDRTPVQPKPQATADLPSGVHIFRG